MKTSEKTAEEKTHFYSLLTGAVPRLDFVLHMIKVTQYLADVEHHLEFEKKKPKTSLKLLLVRELIFFFPSLIPNSSNIDAFRWQPTRPTVPKHQYFRSWETQSYSVTIFSNRSFKDRKRQLFKSPPPSVGTLFYLLILWKKNAGFEPSQVTLVWGEHIIAG